MATTSDAQWLDAWEHALGLPLGLREAALLCPVLPDVDASLLPLGERDRLLLALRAQLFGPQLHCFATCPHCDERCEWSCAVDALRALEPGVSGSSGAWTWQEGELVVQFRLPTGRDLASLSSARDVEHAGQCLLAACVTGASRAGRPLAVDELSTSVREAVALAMAEADPQLLSAVELRCPACEHAWECDFDVGTFLWAELDAWAQHTLSDVHQLALHYGWSEREILAMNPVRRGRYLALVNA